MEFRHCCNAYFHWCGLTRQWKVQGRLTLKAKAFGFVQYAL